MLKKLKALIFYHLQAATLSFNALCRRPLATLLTVIVIAITLTLPALFWVITDNLKQLTANWQGSGHITLYLKTTLSQVEQAKLDMQGLTRLHAILSFSNKIAQAIIILLALAVLLIIGNTLRLALHNRQDEVQILKLIGATDAFILRPFLYAGIWYGMLGAIFAVFFINIFMLSVAVAVRELSSTYPMHYPLLGLSIKQAYLIVFTAIFLGWLGARLAVKKHLSSIEPYP